MKKILLAVLATLSVSAFAQTETPAYVCRYSGNIQNKVVGEEFLLQAGAGAHQIVKTIGDKTYFFEFNITYAQHNFALQYMEGEMVEGARKPKVGSTTRFTVGQQGIFSSSFICAADRSCYELDCDIYRY